MLLFSILNAIEQDAVAATCPRCVPAKNIAPDAFAV
jgi:hypothetical protein